MPIHEVTKSTKPVPDLAVRPLVLELHGDCSSLVELPCILSRSDSFLDFQDVNLSYHIYSLERELVVFDGDRTPVVSTFVDQLVTKCVIAIRLPSTSGQFLIQPTLVKEGHYWFEDIDFVTTWTISLNVTEKTVSLDKYSGFIKNRLISLRCFR